MVVSLAAGVVVDAAGVVAPAAVVEPEAAGEDTLEEPVVEPVAEPEEDGFWPTHELSDELWTVKAAD